MEIAGQAVALVGSALFIASCLTTVRLRILVLGLVSSVILILAYLIRDDIAASFLVCIALSRNALFIAAGSSLRSRRSVWLTLTAVAVVGWALTAGSSHLFWWTPLPLAGSALLLLAYSLSSMTWLKLLQVVNGILWLTYELLSHAYTVMIGEAVGVVFAAVALGRIRGIHPAARHTRTST